MNSNRLLILFLSLALVTACKKKDVFPDLAKMIEGNWNVYDAYILTDLRDSAYHYNPSDSGEVARIQVRKIDPLRVQILMSVKKRNGAMVFETDFESELSRDFNNEGLILFHTYPSASGGYHSKEKRFEISAVSRTDGVYTGKVAWFEAKR